MVTPKNLKLRKYAGAAMVAVSLAVSVGEVLLVDVTSVNAAPAAVTSGIQSAIATVSALDGLAIAALVVALTPLGAMMTLRFLNMVLSRV